MADYTWYQSQKPKTQSWWGDNKKSRKSGWWAQEPTVRAASSVTSSVTPTTPASTSTVTPRYTVQSTTPTSGSVLGNEAPQYTPLPGQEGYTGSLLPGQTAPLAAPQPLSYSNFAGQWTGAGGDVSSLYVPNPSAYNLASTVEDMGYIQKVKSLFEPLVGQTLVGPDGQSYQIAKESITDTVNRLIAAGYIEADLYARNRYTAEFRNIAANDCMYYAIGADGQRYEVTLPQVPKPRGTGGNHVELPNVWRNWSTSNMRQGVYTPMNTVVNNLYSQLIGGQAGTGGTAGGTTSGGTTPTPGQGSDTWDYNTMQLPPGYYWPSAQLWNRMSPSEQEGYQAMLEQAGYYPEDFYWWMQNRLWPQNAMPSRPTWGASWWS